MDWIQLIASQQQQQPLPTAVSPPHTHQQHNRTPLAASPAASPTLSIPPPSVIRVGIICVRVRRSPGQASYSPGLEHDARLYERAFAEGNNSNNSFESSEEKTNTTLTTSVQINGTRFETVAISPDWDRSGCVSEATLTSLKANLDVIIGLEECGSADMIEEILDLRDLSTADRPAPVVIWVPNCEVMDDSKSAKNSKWRATLDALPSGFIDLILCKMPNKDDFMLCIREVYKAYHTELKDSQIVHVPHTSFEEEAPAAKAAAAAAAKKKAASSGRGKQNKSSSTSSSTEQPSSSIPMPSFLTGSSLSNSNIVVPQHAHWFYEPAHRWTILHFAGSSPHKNTVENAKAGVEIVRRLNAMLSSQPAAGGGGSSASSSAAASDSENAEAADATTSSNKGKRDGGAHKPQKFRLVVFLCPWPSKGGNGPAMYAIGAEAYEALRQLQQANSDIMQLVAGGFMSYPERRKLYAKTRLALCASRAEGFGHYVLEAAASGCMVVTTDGLPMRSLLVEPDTFALATPSNVERQCYGYGYVVPADAIVQAAFSLKLLESQGYSSDIIRRAVRNEAIARAKFSQGMQQLKQLLTQMVADRLAAFLRRKMHGSGVIATSVAASPQPSHIVAPTPVPVPGFPFASFSGMPSTPLPPMPSVSPDGSGGGAFKKGIFAPTLNFVKVPAAAASAGPGTFLTPPPGLGGLTTPSPQPPAAPHPSPASSASSIHSGSAFAFEGFAHMLQPSPPPHLLHAMPHSSLPQQHMHGLPSQMNTTGAPALQVNVSSPSYYTSPYASASSTLFPSSPLNNLSPHHQQQLQQSQQHHHQYHPHPHAGVAHHPQQVPSPSIYSAVPSQQASPNPHATMPVLPPMPVFHTGMNSLAAIEAKMRASASSSAQPPPSSQQLHQLQANLQTTPPKQQTTQPFHHINSPQIQYYPNSPDHPYLPWPK